MDENLSKELFELEGAALISLGHLNLEPYKLTTDVEIVSDQEYYEKSENYILTTDTEVDKRKTYYQKISEEQYIKVDAPEDDPTQEGYYELQITYTLKEISEGSPSAMGLYVKAEDFGTGTTKNYGIGINSSDDFLALPARAISLFQTKIKPDQSIRVNYEFQSILGTLPNFADDMVANVYSAYMVDTQGLFTDNIYIGDKNNYLAFYSDNEDKKHLKIVASDIVKEVRYNDYISCKGEVFDEDITYYIYSSGNDQYIEVDNPQPEDINSYFRLVDENSITWDDYIDDQKLKYIWENLSVSDDEYKPGLYMASGGLIEGNRFQQDDPSTYGFNSFINHNSLNLRYNAVDLLSLQSIEGLTIYVPQMDNNQISGNNKRIQISGDQGIQFFGQGIDYTTNQIVDKVVAQYNQNYAKIGQAVPEKEPIYTSCEGEEFDEQTIYYIYDNELKQYRIVENPRAQDIDIYFKQTLIDTHKNYTLIDPDGLHLRNTYFDLTNESISEQTKQADVASFSSDAIKFNSATEFYLGDENKRVFIKFYKNYPFTPTLQNPVNDLIIKAKSFILGDDAHNDKDIAEWIEDTNDKIGEETNNRKVEINGITDQIGIVENKINDLISNGKIFIDTNTPQIIVGHNSNPENKTILTTNSLSYQKAGQVAWNISSEESRLPQITSTKIKLQTNITNTNETNFFYWEKRKNGHLSLKLD